MVVLRALAVVAGVALAVYTLGSAIRTVVLPRAAVSTLTRAHFRWLRMVFDALARPSHDFDRRDRVMAMYAPVALVLLPFMWVLMIVVAFTFIFWGVGVNPFAEAFIVSGSSLLTLGFDRPQGTGRIALSFVEAAIGLGLISLMISYLPTIYGAFRTRENLVGMLETRAGLPPSPSELFVRYQRIQMLDQLDDDLFRPWEQWFVDVEESHTSQPSLVFFRSPHPGRNWLTAAGCVLDTASVAMAALDRPYQARPALMVRSGFLCLRRIADFYGIAYDPDPKPDDPISVSRVEFEDLIARLRRQGVPVKDDLDAAWRDFQGWRVNYDEVLLELCALIMAPPAAWSSDRMPIRRTRPPLRQKPR